jgi:hypothetical protein
MEDRYVLIDICWRVNEPVDNARYGNRHPRRRNVPLDLTQIVLPDCLFLTVPVDRNKGMMRSMHINVDQPQGISLRHLLTCIHEFYVSYELSDEDVSDIHRNATPNEYDFKHEHAALTRLYHDESIRWMDWIGDFTSVSYLQVSEDGNVGKLWLSRNY